MKSEQEIKEQASVYSRKCDPLNQTLEKQADIRQGFIAGAKWIQEQDNWISVEDGLPEKDGNSSIYCLVMAKGYGMVVRPYNEYHLCWDDEDGDDHFTTAKDGIVTHWQPLPSPPKQ
jgi:hypothetical protein